jgi:hypothetical protein
VRWTAVNGGVLAFARLEVGRHDRALGVFGRVASEVVVRIVLGLASIVVTILFMGASCGELPAAAAPPGLMSPEVTKAVEVVLAPGAVARAALLLWELATIKEFGRRAAAWKMAYFFMRVGGAR